METRPGEAGMMVPMVPMIKALPVPQLVHTRSGGPGVSDPSGRFAVEEVAAVMKILPNNVHKTRT